MQKVPAAEIADLAWGVLPALQPCVKQLAQQTQSLVIVVMFSSRRSNGTQTAMFISHCSSSACGGLLGENASKLRSLMSTELISRREAPVRPCKLRLSLERPRDAAGRDAASRRPAPRRPRATRQRGLEAARAPLPKIAAGELILTAL